ncbi:asparagine synthase (glutamine-hydrolyzing) [Paraflavitalea sp. CAU 1676]|uniref:asparagine synthase (glutamine-hydrolyzing) n=1 Tax=Paraflavitalea sp. CAU 1676 TaxID=3032598 RepID=UPI0023DAE52C|nr:asparagine synthase (glutamine-hydrolyzing) [Paraflavitalea sp. CAU 1676]MDF2187076.1 asparagine synthase (glutamine-hydrolyzing) [Paraflavitalea sp. CAU 1676]
MCGIAGILHFRQPLADPSTIKKMTDAMAHRGPDAHNDFIEDEVALGHRRLSIIDLSTAANQPFTDPSGRYRMVYNGEIYNFKEVRDRLSDYPFTTTGDTEVLLAAYIKWGADCLPLLKGMFAFAIWDRVEKVLFIARDRMGVKPIYYFANDHHFLFASEIRGILATGLVPNKISTAAVREFLSYQSIGFPLSIIENIFQLDAGSWMTIRQGKITTRKYWDITSTSTEGSYDDKSQVLRTIRQLLRDSVERRLVSDVPIGAFLSGGIDSSAVVGLMAEVSSARPNTFTIGFSEKEFDESDYAATIARKFNTNHNQVLLKPSVFLDELDNALNAMDTPSGDGVNTYVVSKAIRQNGLTVALSGVGGDELFAGYPFFKQFLQLKKFSKMWGIAGPARQIAASVLALKGSNKAGRLQQLLKAPACSIAAFYPEFRRILSGGLLTNLTHLDRQSTALENNLLQLNGSMEKFPSLSQVSIAEYLGYTQHTLLKDTDQMSMAVSLEVREPFFDHDLVTYVLGIPDHFKFPHTPKGLLVDSLQGLLPHEVVHRRKQGFLFPWSVWMKNELFAFCDQRLKRISERDFVDGKALLAYWDRFRKGDPGVRWMELWLFVVLEYWMEKNSSN